MLETRPKAFVFVLMPFSDTFGDIYELGIKAACKEADAYCERVDEQIFDGNILERVYNQIAKADVIVAEMTGRNPNVFYEVGYAHALNKRVILLTQNADDIPFDLKQFPHIVYGGKIATLKSQLETRVRWCIENPQESLSRVDVELEFFINDLPLLGQPEIALQRDVGFYAAEESYQTVYLSWRNIGRRVLDHTSYRIALVIPNHADLSLQGPYSTTILPGNKAFYYLKTESDSLYPGAWQSINIHLRIIYSGEAAFQLELQVFTELDTKSYPFTLRFPTH